MNLPRLELTEDPNKNNDFIIFRYSSKGKKIKQSKSVTKKRFSQKGKTTKKRRTRKSRKGLFNIF
jgi:hypothetical protein